MRHTSALCTVLMLCLAGLVLTAPQAAADDKGPEITEVARVPNYPLVGQNVTIFATVTDPDGIDMVYITYCDEYLCYFPAYMSDPDQDGVYSGVIPWESNWENGTWIGYEIEARDNNNPVKNSNVTKKAYYHFTTSMNCTIEADKDTLYLGDILTIDGKALYDGNETAYVVNSNVTVTVVETGEKFYTTTDDEGNFTLEVLFDTPGSYTLNTTVSNRTLAAYDDVDVTVIGITRFSEDLQVTTCYPQDDIWVNGTATYSTGAPVESSDVEVRINETLFWSGKTDDQGRYAILITAPLDVDTYYVNVTVVNGTLSASNSTTLSVTEVPLPDMYIKPEDMTFSSTNDPPIPGEAVTVSVVVRNLGLADCTDVNVSFYYDVPYTGQLLGSTVIPEICMGDSSNANAVWTAVQGTHDIWAVVDPANATAESFEDNNEASISIFVDGDLDEDGIGDGIDTDDDGDGVDDDQDAFPMDAAASVDTDGDGRPDDWNQGQSAANSTTGLEVDSDDDGDGVSDDLDPFPLDDTEWLDTDGDGIGDNTDTDDDEDGLLDSEEDANGNGVVDPGETDPVKFDTDGDGVGDKTDYDPLDPSVTEEPSAMLWILLIVVIVVVVAVVVLLVILMKKKGKK